MDSTTLVKGLSSEDFKTQLGINLSSIQEVTNSIQNALKNDQLKSMGDMASLISPDNLVSMVQNQANLISCTLNSLASSASVGQDDIQSTLNNSFSAVLNVMTCSLANVQNSLMQISEMSKQIENIKSAINVNNIEELRK